MGGVSVEFKRPSRIEDCTILKYTRQQKNKFHLVFLAFISSLDLTIIIRLYIFILFILPPTPPIRVYAL